MGTNREKQDPSGLGAGRILRWGSHGTGKGNFPGVVLRSVSEHGGADRIKRDSRDANPKGDQDGSEGCEATGRLTLRQALRERAATHRFPGRTFWAVASKSSMRAAER